MELEVIKFIKENKNWRDLLTNSPYNLIINEDENYCLLKYNQIKSDFSLNIVKECRGLIIDKETLSPKALSFTKFFNYGEPNACKIDWKSAKVQEKVDGSKILVWYDKNKWHISTSGIINAFSAPISDFGFTFGDVFIEALEKNGLHFSPHNGIIYDTNLPVSILEKNKCYTFELISPKTRVVVPYKDTTLKLIGVRETVLFEELNPKNVFISQYIQLPKEYNINSLESCIQATEKMGFDEEGFVVVDKYWNRIKIKSPAYVAAHHIRSSVCGSKSALLELIEKREIDEFLTYYPEWKDEVKEIQLQLNLHHKYALTAINWLQEYIKIHKPTRAEIAKKIYSDNELKKFASLMFKFLDTNLVELFIETEWDKLTSKQKLEKINVKGEN